MPTALGETEVTADIWRPATTGVQSHLSMSCNFHAVHLLGWFLGANPQVKSADLVVNPESRQRSRLCTVSAGTIVLRINVIIQHIEKLNFELVKLASSAPPTPDIRAESMTASRAERWQSTTRSLASLRQTLRNKLASPEIKRS